LDDPRQLVAQARALEKRGDGKAAAEAFARAGAYEDAARLFLATGSFAKAGRCSCVRRNTNVVSRLTPRPRAPC